MSNWNGFVWMKFNNDWNAKNFEWFKKHANWVKEYGSTAGEWDGYLKVSAPSFEDVEKFVCEELRKQPWVRDTCTQPAHWWNNAA